MDLSENTEYSISDTTTRATVRVGDHCDLHKRCLEEVSGTHTTTFNLSVYSGGGCVVNIKIIITWRYIFDSGQLK